MKRTLFGIGLFAFVGLWVFAQQKPVVAVAPFEAVSGITPADANVITGIFNTRLGNANVVTLVDRSVVERVIQEHKFQLGDWSNKDKTAALGDALNADWIVRGEIAKLGADIIVNVQFYDIKTFQFKGGADISFANVNEARAKITPLVDSLVQTIGGGTGTKPPAANPPPNNMVRIQGGTFTMGSPANESGRHSDEGPQHQVTVSSFYMGKYEVTQKEYREVMGTNPSSFKGDNLPVENVSWFDAVEYCNKRSQKEGLTPAYTISGSIDNKTLTWNVTWNRSANGYRLPTEAEWEYACRAGTTTAYNTGASISNNTGWYEANSGNTTHPVGQKSANAWGLHDMHGNVWEWCWDWFGSYSSGAQTDPVGTSSVPRSGVDGLYGTVDGRVYRGGSPGFAFILCQTYDWSDWEDDDDFYYTSPYTDNYIDPEPEPTTRVNRGGSWDHSAQNVRSAGRGNNTPSGRYYDVGFRVLRP